MKRSRIAITGMGVLCPLGKGVAAFREALHGMSAPIAAIPEHWATFWKAKSSWWAPLPAEWIQSPAITSVEAKQLDPVVVLAMEASREAMEMAGIASGSPSGGVFYGTACGGLVSVLRNHINHLPEARPGFLGEPVARYNPFAVSMVMLNATAGTLSNKFKIHGPSRSFVSSCTSSTVAIGNAMRALQAGEVDWCIAGGTEYLVDETGCLYRGFDVAATLTRIQDPSRCNRPFDRDRNGFLFAAGGAASLVLEREEHALARGAEVLAWLEGYGENCDAHSPMAPQPEGEFIRQCVRKALHDAGVASHGIDAISAHGTGTMANDAVEGEMIRDLFPHRPLVTTTKALTGHLLGASGAVETVAAIAMLQGGFVHGMPALDDPSLDLNFAVRTTTSPIGRMAKFSFGFGGHNAVLILSRKDAFS